MDYEKEYKSLIAKVKKAHLFAQTDSTKSVLEDILPELRESEDEHLRKLLVWQVHRNIEDETNDLKMSVYDGIKGHDPDLEESIEDWKKCLAWLEKQKEPKPLPGSEDCDGIPGKDYIPVEWVDACERYGKWEIVEQEPVDWSEEDVNDVIERLKLAYKETKNEMFLEDIMRLKSLRPQKKDSNYWYGYINGLAEHWKPSEEQFKELRKKDG